MNQLKKNFFFCAILLLGACSGPETGTENQIDEGQQLVAALRAFPELLDRNEQIRQGKEWESAQNAYAENRLKAIKGNREALLNVACLFMQEARVTGEHGHYYPASLQLLDELLQSEGVDADLRFRGMSAKAAVLLSQHEFASALGIAEKAVEMNAYNAQIYGVLTDGYIETGDYEKAIAAAEKMVMIRPDLRSYARISYLREIHGQQEEAIDAMQLAVQAGYPGYEETSWAQLELGHLYARYGQPAAAEREYRAILEHRSDYPFAISALAELRLAEGDYAAAEELLKKACNIIPEVGFYVQMAELYRHTDRIESFEVKISEILAMLQDDVESGHNMDLEYADLYLDLQEDYVAALTYARRAFEARPNNIDTNRKLALVYARMGNSEAAKKHYERAAVTGSKHPELLELREILADKLAMRNIN